MHLLHVRQLKLEEFSNEYTLPDYAILSHTWGDGEVSFQDLPTPAARSMPGYLKIKQCCEQAIRDGFEYVWIDTCCIDKTSSAELSEAVNSMYRWYKDATVCYVYLSDVRIKTQASLFTVTAHNDLGVHSLDGKTSTPNHLFRESRWFRRGWTLQELIAPENIVFYDSNWVEIGTKNTLHEAISSITGIPRNVLVERKSLKDISISQRMSWAASRTTTRVEDVAYSLMGIFGVNMPALYGEAENAFIRLQHEIMKISDDHTLFAWVDSSVGWMGLFSDHINFNESFANSFRTGLGNVLAKSPRDFKFGHHIQRRKRLTGRQRSSYSITNKGLHIWLPLINTPGKIQAVLDCELTDGRGPLSIFLFSLPLRQYIRTSVSLIAIVDEAKLHGDHGVPRELYITDASNTLRKSQQSSHYQFHFHLRGYKAVELDPPDVWLPNTTDCILSSSTRSIPSCALMLSVNGDSSTKVIIALKIGKDIEVISCNIYMLADLPAQNRTLSGCRKKYLEEQANSSIDRITKRLPSGEISVAIKRGLAKNGMFQHYHVLITSGPLSGLSYIAGRGSELTLESWESKFGGNGYLQIEDYLLEEGIRQDEDWDGHEDDGGELGWRDDESFVGLDDDSRF